jgi:arabinogalactan oligomer / maltooligosaccharide transport system permease protein
MFDLEQAWTAFSDVVSSLLIIILAIVALEALLYLALMAKRGERGATVALLAAPLTAAGAYFLLSLEAFSLDGLTSLSSDSWISIVVIAGVVLALAGAIWSFWTRRRTTSARLALPAMLLAPAIAGVGLLYVYPLLYELNLSFTSMSVRNFVDPGLLGLTWEGTILEPFGAEREIFVGLDNYVNVFTKPILQQTGFWQLFLQTIVWTVVCIFFHVTLGVALALMLNRQMRGRTFYRAVLILPWAIPVFISLQIWRTEFNFQFGAVNQLLGIVGIEPIPWMIDPFWNFTAMIISNVWLGVPFMMVITLGGLQAISSDYYEASEIDGANGRQQLFRITLPLLRPVLVPAVLLGVFLTFNNIMVPFFINQNSLESSDILVTALYRAAFEFNRFGFSAAFAFVIFLILLAFTLWYVRVTNVLKGAYES